MRARIHSQQQRELTGMIEAMQRELSTEAEFTNRALTYHAGLLSVWLSRIGEAYAHISNPSSATRLDTAAHRLAEAFTALVDGKFNATSPFAPESYDAAALIMLAMQAAGSSDPGVYKDKVMEVANAPGEPIGVGELAKGLEILANGGDIDHVGASGVELIGPGEAAGNYREIVVEGGQIETVQFR